MVQVLQSVRPVETLQNARPRGRSGIARRALRLIPGKKGIRLYPIKLILP